MRRSEVVLITDSIPTLRCTENSPAEPVASSSQSVVVRITRVFTDDHVGAKSAAGVEGAARDGISSMKVHKQSQWKNRFIVHEDSCVSARVNHRFVIDVAV